MVAARVASNRTSELALSAAFLVIEEEQVSVAICKRGSGAEEEEQEKNKKLL
jgi:hypothetical protein